MELPQANSSGSDEKASASLTSHKAAPLIPRGVARHGLRTLPLASLPLRLKPLPSSSLIRFLPVSARCPACGRLLIIRGVKKHNTQGSLSPPPYPSPGSSRQRRLGLTPASAEETESVLRRSRAASPRHPARRFLLGSGGSDSGYSREKRQDFRRKAA